MDIRQWDYDKDSKYIESFLTTASLSHKIEKKNREWFNWKYRDTPNGQCILVCAFEDQEVVGCVAMRRGVVSIEGERMNYGASYENFVHPSFQGRGLFVKLIGKAEEICRNQSMEFLICFPNEKSYKGYIKSGWTEVGNMRCALKCVSITKVLLNIRSLREKFVKLSADTISGQISDRYNECNTIGDKKIVPIWSKEYMKWRFWKYPQAKYFFVEKEEYFGMARIGYRGALKEGQIIHISSYGSSLNQEMFDDFVKEMSSREKLDIISFNYNATSHMSKFTKKFIYVPTKVRMVYKSFGKYSPNNMDIDAMFFHTY